MNFKNLLIKKNAQKKSQQRMVIKSKLQRKSMKTCVRIFEVQNITSRHAQSEVWKKTQYRGKKEKKSHSYTSTCKKKNF